MPSMQPNAVLSKTMLFLDDDVNFFVPVQIGSLRNNGVVDANGRER